MPVEIFVSDPSAEPEYQTIMEEELTDKDTVIEHIVEQLKLKKKKGRRN